MSGLAKLRPSAVALAFLACAPCDRSGCDAIEHHAADQGTGVAGVVAVADDVSVNGCLACPLGQASLELWHVDEPIDDDEAAQAIVSARTPDLAAEADERYFLALEAGYHLLCASRYACVSIEVHSDETLTVHLVHPLGERGYFVGRPGEELREVATLRVEIRVDSEG